MLKDELSEATPEDEQTYLDLLRLPVEFEKMAKFGGDSLTKEELYGRLTTATWEMSLYLSEGVIPANKQWLFFYLVTSAFVDLMSKGHQLTDDNVGEFHALLANRGKELAITLRNVMFKEGEDTGDPMDIDCSKCPAKDRCEYSDAEDESCPNDEIVH